MLDKSRIASITAATQPPFQTTIAGFRIELRQTGIDRFRVQYGKHRRTGLDYENAARELGECILHACQVAGTITSDF
jgi:hypothetical protein